MCAYSLHHSPGDFGKLVLEASQRAQHDNQEKLAVKPQAHPPQYHWWVSRSVDRGQSRALSTYLVCWTNPGTLVKMFMSALRGYNKAP